MRILACHNYYQWRGGEDQSFEDEVANLRVHGHDVSTYVVHNDAIKNTSKLKVALQTLWNPGTYKKCREMLRRQRPDILHCTNHFPQLSPSILYAAHREGVPVVQSLRNFRAICASSYLLRDGKICELCLNRRIPIPAIKYKCYRESRSGSAVVVAWQSLNRMLGTWNRKVDAFLTLTAFARDKLLHLGVDPQKVFVKHNCVLKDPGIGPGDENVAVFAGRLSSEKGIACLLDAFDRPDTSLGLRIYGDGPMMEEVRSRAAQNPKIEAMGSRPLDEVLDAMGRAKCVLQTSLWYETFGRTIIEGYARGTPVIASRLGAMQELVDEGNTGFLFEPGNALDLASKLKHFTDDDDRYAKLRVGARQSFETSFTAEHNYKRLLEIYQYAIDHQRNSAK